MMHKSNNLSYTALKSLFAMFKVSEIGKKATCKCVASYRWEHNIFKSCDLAVYRVKRSWAF